MELTPTPRTKIRRVPQRASYDRGTVDAILDEALICHLSFVHDGHPFCLPTLHARVGDQVFLHASSKARWARGGDVCLTATLVDGLVLARSAFHHSMNYRSAVVVGPLRTVELPDEKMLALEAFTERLMPGRWDEVRRPNRKELKATSVLAMRLDEASAKVRAGGPVDDEEDLALPVWAGVVPLQVAAGAPQADGDGEREAPAYVTGWSPSSRGSSRSATVRSTASGANGASSSDARAA
jgi:uncharacterized protein